MYAILPGYPCHLRLGYQGEKKPEETEIECVTSRRVTTTTTTTARVRSDAMLLRGETGALRLRSLQLWQRGSLTAQQRGSPLPTTP